MLSSEMFWRLTVSIITVVIEGRLVVFPSNTVVNEGSQVRFNCSSDAPNSNVRWLRNEAQNHSSSEPGMGKPVSGIIISTGKRIYSKFNSSYFLISSSDGQFDLMVNRTMLSLAGTYTCQEAGTQMTSSAELVVLASSLICNNSAFTDVDNNKNNNNTNSTIATLQCTVSVRGNWLPVMEWTLYDGVHRNVTSETKFQGDRMISTIHFNLDTELAAGTTSYTCKMFFKESMKKESTDASNVPGFTLSWSHYLPTSMNTSHLSHSDETLTVPGNISEIKLPVFILIAIGVSFVVLLTIIITMCAYIASIRKPKRESDYCNTGATNTLKRTGADDYSQGSDYAEIPDNTDVKLYTDLIFNDDKDVTQQ